MHPSMDGFLCLDEGTFEESLMVALTVMMCYGPRTVMAGGLADI